MEKVTKDVAQEQLTESLQDTVRQRIQGILESKLLAAAKHVEQQVDEKLREEAEMSSDELERLREGRIRTMQKAVAARRKWRAQGHGRYDIVDEREFFQVVEKSQRVVVHFYREATFRCKILDRHLKTLAERHLETLFIRVNVEKSPFLVQRLGVRVLPCMRVIRNGEFGETLYGFEAFGNTDDFKTKDLARVLAELEIIREDGEMGREESEEVDDEDLELQLSD